MCATNLASCIASRLRRSTVSTDTQKSIAESLTRYGCNLIVASGGREALRKAGAEQTARSSTEALQG
jgi:hypothetical protein